MDALGLGLKVSLQLGLRFQAQARVEVRLDVNFVQRRRQIRQHERVRIFRAQIIAPLLGQISLIGLLIHREQELLLLRI
jgi:hypothetical protein